MDFMEYDRYNIWTDITYSFLTLSTSCEWKCQAPHEQGLVLNPEAEFIHALLLGLWSTKQYQHHQEFIGNLESQVLSQTY